MSARLHALSDRIRGAHLCASALSASLSAVLAEVIVASGRHDLQPRTVAWLGGVLDTVTRVQTQIVSEGGPYRTLRGLAAAAPSARLPGMLGEAGAEAWRPLTAPDDAIVCPHCGSTEVTPDGFGTSSSPHPIHVRHQVLSTEHGWVLHAPGYCHDGCGPVAIVYEAQRCTAASTDQMPRLVREGGE